MKNRKLLFLVGAMLVVGVLLGIFISSEFNRPRETAGPVATPSPSGLDASQKIAPLKALVAQEPENRGAWVDLGNAYYDSGQPMEAVKAYGEALKLDPNDPNVLTDQGVMYRRLGMYQRAADNFAQAHRVDPTHAQSLYNLGVVYRYDLKDLAKAREAWKKFLALQPVGPQADHVRGELKQMQALSGGFQGK